MVSRVVHCRGGTRKRVGHGSGGIHLHYSKTKHLIDLVTSKALSRQRVLYSVDT